VTDGNGATTTLHNSSSQLYAIRPSKIPMAFRQYPLEPVKLAT